MRNACNACVVPPHEIWTLSLAALAFACRVTGHSTYGCAILCMLHVARSVRSVIRVTRGRGGLGCVCIDMQSHAMWALVRWRRREAASGISGRRHVPTTIGSIYIGSGNATETGGVRPVRITSRLRILPIDSNGAAYWEASCMGLLRINGFALTSSIKTRQALTRQQALHRSPRSARDPRGRSFSAPGCARAFARGYRRSSPAPHA